MANPITGFDTKDGVAKYDYNALANRPEDGTGTIISGNADYAEVGEWADGNPDSEERLGYFVAIAAVEDNTIKIRKATSQDDVKGVTVFNPAFSGNAAAEKYISDGVLYPQYSYVGLMGIVSVIDNGTCTVGGRCMPADDGTAVPSSNNMGYGVLERIDASHVLIAVEPGADMIQRIKTDMSNIPDEIYVGDGDMPEGATIQIILDAEDDEQALKDELKAYIDANIPEVKDGTSVTVVNVSESTTDGGSNVVTFSDGNKLTIKNGSQGSPGTPGNDYVITETDKAEIAENLKGVCVAKNQGSANVGKILMVGTDGNLILVDMPEGGASGDVIGTIDENNNIILTGELAKETYTIKYENADGSYTDIGTLDLQEKPKYTNLAEPLPNNTTDTTKWVNGQRISSSGISAQNGKTVTNMISCKNGDVIRIKGVNMVSGTDRIAVFGTTFSSWAAGYFNNGIDFGSIKAVAYNGLADGVYTFTVTSDKTHTYTGLRIAMNTPADASAVIITKNEEIV